MISRLLMCLWLAACATSIQAQQFSPPEQITYSGKAYNLAYKNSLPDGRAIFEYTSNDEPIERWSSLVTLHYSKSLVTSPLKRAEAVKIALDREKPKPNYSLYIKGNNGYAKIIYEPDSKNTTYESNVHKSFHIEACGGLLIYQFAQKYPPSADQTAEGKLSMLKQIANENARFADEMEKSDWLPNCK